MIVVVICGIPGSGKSTFAKRISQQFEGILVSFDDYLELQDEWDSTTFRSSRSRSFGALDDAMDAVLTQNLDVPIIIDDIMYLHSMRREVYTVVRDRGGATVVVWVNTELAVALQRNSERAGAARLEEAAINKIAMDFEPPNSKHIADRIQLTVDGTSTESLEEGVRTLQALLKLLWTDRRNPTVVETMSFALPETAKMKSNNFAADIDKKLRKLSTDIMKLLSAIPVEEWYTHEINPSDSGDLSLLPTDHKRVKKQALAFIGELLSVSKQEVLALARTSKRGSQLPEESESSQFPVVSIGSQSREATEGSFGSYDQLCNDQSRPSATAAVTLSSVGSIFIASVLSKWPQQSLQLQRAEPESAGLDSRSIVKWDIIRRAVEDFSL